MIWQQNKSYKAISVFQLLFIIGSYILDLLAHSKMGVDRHLVYNIYAWEKSGISTYIIVGVIITAILYIVVRIFSIAKLGYDDVLFIILLAISTLAYFNLLPILKHDYYHQAIIYLLIALLQIAKIKLKKS